MSILLEALRKSERREHLGQVPTIHQPDDEAPPGQRPLNRPLAIALLLLVAAVLAALFWRQYAPAPEPQPMVVPSQPAVAEALPEPQPSVAAAIQDEASQPPSTGRREARTPMERLLPPGPDALATDTVEQAAKPENPVSDGQPAWVPDETATMEAIAKPAVATVQLPPRTAESPMPSGTANQPHQSAPISFWQLPPDVRSQLPPMKVTVLVWAERPEDRFVLLDSRRRVEGDEIAPGLTLEEVQRDGVVLSYHAYRFLVHH